MQNLIFILPKYNETTFTSILKPTLDRIPVKLYCSEDNPESGVINSTVVKFNAGIDHALQRNDILDNDIVVFIHEDVNILDNLFKEKIHMVFDSKPDVGIVGVVGHRKLTSKLGKFDVGQYVQGNSDGTIGNGELHNTGNVGFYDDCVSVGSFFIAVRGSLINSRTIDIHKIHDIYYSYDMCFQALKNGFKVAVVDIFCYHHSNKRYKLQWIEDHKEDWKQFLGKDSVEFSDIFIKTVNNAKVMVEI